MESVRQRVAGFGTSRTKLRAGRGEASWRCIGWKIKGLILVWWQRERAHHRPDPGVEQLLVQLPRARKLRVASVPAARSGMVIGSALRRDRNQAVERTAVDD
jgi:hypothetical protein